MAQYPRSPTTTKPGQRDSKLAGSLDLLGQAKDQSREPTTRRAPESPEGFLGSLVQNEPAKNEAREGTHVFVGPIIFEHRVVPAADQGPLIRVVIIG